MLSTDAEILQVLSTDAEIHVLQVLFTTGIHRNLPMSNLCHPAHFVCMRDTCIELFSSFPTGITHLKILRAKKSATFKNFLLLKDHDFGVEYDQS